MKALVERSGDVYRVSINGPTPVVKFDFTPSEQLSESALDTLGITFEEKGQRLIFTKKLGLEEHIFGLGEKAYELDRKRTSTTMWNTDSYGYGWGRDPLYVSIPFFISLERGKATGFFINSPAKLTFDFGVKEYDKVSVEIPHPDAEVYVFTGGTVEKIVEDYTSLTGKPLDPPLWAFGYQASRYSYFPQEKVLEIAKKHFDEGINLAAIHLDIDYMDKYKIFTWGPSFKDPKAMIDELHRMGVKVVTIVDHGVKAEQGYDVFVSGLGHYCELEDGGIYLDKMWPGTCAYPDFFNEECRKWWGDLIKKWASQGVDGIWLDMNEPSTLTPEHDFRGPVVHRLDDGRRLPHELVRNAYPYFEAKATYEALKGLVDKPFVLSRAGYPGIQKYAFIWTGDNTSTQEAIPLQISLALSLSLSGIPFVGCDLGGFTGRSNPALVLRYYRAALFFPLFRNHKDKGGNDQEPFNFYNEKELKEAISIREKFLPYMYALAREAHERGHPIVRPLFYEFQEDQKSYGIVDEYLVGKWLLYAPQIYGDERKVYLPEGNWADFWTGRQEKGPTWVTAQQEYPIYLRENCIIPMEGELRAFGKAVITLVDGSTAAYDGTKWTAPAGFEKGFLYVNGSIAEKRLD